MKSSTFLVLAFCSALFLQSSAQQFPCDGKLYFFRYDNGVNWLSYIDGYLTTSPVVADVCSLTVTGQNALGANPIDHYLYFIASPAGSLYRMDANCNLTVVCTNIASTTQGCFDNQGRYWILSGTTLEAYDISTCTVVKGPYTVAATAGIDIVFSAADCHLYMGDATHVIQVDTNGVVTLTTTTGFGGTGSFGGFAIGADGNLYGMPNGSTTGQLYGYNISTQTSLGLVYSFPNGTANACGCDMASFPCPTLTAGFSASPTQICGVPAVVQFTNQSSGLVNRFSWDFGDGTTDTANYNPSHNYTSPGTYTISLAVSAVSQCLSVPPDTFRLTVMVSPAVVASINGNASICSGQSTSLTATGATIYAWSTGDTTATINVTPSSNTNYSVTVSDANGCSSSNSVTVTVNPMPVVIFAPFTTTYCLTDPAFVLTGGSPSGGTYSGNGVSGNMFSPATAGVGTYTLTYNYTSSAGCSGTATTTITVDPTGTVLINSIPQLCIGSAAVNLVGDPAGGTFSGTGVVGNTFDPTVSGAGTFTITYTYTGGHCITNNTATTTVTVTPAPTVTISSSPTIGCVNHTIYLGYGPQNVTLTANTTANVVAYQWYMNGSPIAGATSQTVTVTSTGSYYVVITDASGCQSIPGNTAAFDLTVVDIRCGEHMQKVILCHVPPGNPNNPQTLCIAPSAVPAHIGNHPGDCLGPCPTHRRDAFETEELTNWDKTFNIYPNPLSDRTVIEFAVPDDGNVRLEIYDVKGSLIATLFSGQAKGYTKYAVNVDGNSLQAGIYVCNLSTNDGVMHRKVVVAK